MKTIFYTLIILLFSTSITFGQNNSITTGTGKAYTFAESIGKNYYAANFTFNKNKKEAIVAVLDSYFEKALQSNKKTIWKKSKGEYALEDSFFIELKNRELKIEWKNTINNTNQSIIDELKKVCKDVIDVIK